MILGPVINYQDGGGGGGGGGATKWKNQGSKTCQYGQNVKLMRILYAKLLVPPSA